MGTQRKFHVENIWDSTGNAKFAKIHHLDLADFCIETVLNSKHFQNSTLWVRCLGSPAVLLTTKLKYCIANKVLVFKKMSSLYRIFIEVLTGDSSTTINFNLILCFTFIIIFCCISESFTPSSPFRGELGPGPRQNNCSGQN